ncbi:MAG: transposase [Candidatus Kapaibacterium sp.]
MRINIVNPDHVHALIDLPVHISIADIVKRLKGASSHWINHQNLIEPKFSWGRGYGVFSVSHSHKERVVQYIANQEEHHKVKTFTDEYREFVERHGLVWRLDA